MIISTIFTCEKCGRPYDNEESCRECENGHLVPQSIGTYEYSRTTRKSVPESIHIKFSDGLYRSYHLFGTGEGFKPTRRTKKDKKKVAEDYPFSP